MEEEMISKSIFDKIITGKDKIIQALQIQISQLERRLLAYENAHTPSSKQKFKKKD